MDCALWCCGVEGHARVAARVDRRDRPDFVNEVRDFDRLVAFDSSAVYTGRKKACLCSSMNGRKASECIY